VLDVLLEAWWDRQPVDEIEANVPQHGELAEMLQRVHTAEPRDRMNETDWGRRQTGPARQQVVQAAAGPRRRYGVIDEVDDRRRSSVVGTAAAARRQGLRTETESTCTRADRISHNTLVTARLQLTFQITQATLHKRKYTRI